MTPTRRTTTGIKTARLASGLLRANGTGRGRHHAPAGPGAGRLDRSPLGPSVGSVGLPLGENAFPRELAVDTPGGTCTGAPLAAWAIQNSPPACSRVAVWSSPQTP